MGTIPRSSINLIGTTKRPMNLTRGTYALMALITALLWIALGNFFSLPAASDCPRGDLEAPPG